MTPDFTSCDWDTTNLRVRIVRDDAVVKETRSGQGAGGTVESRKQARLTCTRNVAEVLQGRMPINPVNRPKDR